MSQASLKAEQAGQDAVDGIDPGRVVHAVHEVGDPAGVGLVAEQGVSSTVLLAVGLNLSGVFEFGQLAPSGVVGWTSKNPALDAFGSGVLVVGSSPVASRRSIIAGSFRICAFGTPGTAFAVPSARCSRFQNGARVLRKSIRNSQA